MSRSDALEEAVRSVSGACPFLGAFGWSPFVAECSWIVDELDDVESDLSVFHRIDDYRDLPSARFFALALRLGAYTGAVQARAVAREQEDNPTPQHRSDGKRTVDDTVALAELQQAGLLEREVA